MSTRALCLLLVLGLFTGCATGPNFYIAVDALATPDAPDKVQYVLLPASSETGTWDLQYQEFAGYIGKALRAKGFVPADSFQSADIAIFVAYGIGEPQFSSYTVSVPQWGQTGISGSHTTGTVNSFGNTATYSGTTTYTPTYGVTGYNTVSGTRVDYYRYLFLEAVDIQAYLQTEELRQVWRTTVTSTGSSGDLRRVMPLLVVAAQDHLGSSTGKQMPITLKESSRRVAELTEK